MFPTSLAQLPGWGPARPTSLYEVRRPTPKPLNCRGITPWHAKFKAQADCLGKCALTKTSPKTSSTRMPRAPRQTGQASAKHLPTLCLHLTVCACLLVLGCAWLFFSLVLLVLACLRVLACVCGIRMAAVPGALPTQGCLARICAAIAGFGVQGATRFATKPVAFRQTHHTSLVYR